MKRNIDSDPFVEMLTDVFVPHCGREDLVHLITDNLRAHLTSRAIEVAQANNIQLPCLHAHSTHKLLPMDARIFNIFKSNLAKQRRAQDINATRFLLPTSPLLINLYMHWILVLASTSRSHSVSLELHRITPPSYFS